MRRVFTSRPADRRLRVDTARLKYMSRKEAPAAPDKQVHVAMHGNTRVGITAAFAQFQSN